MYFPGSTMQRRHLGARRAESPGIGERLDGRSQYLAHLGVIEHPVPMLQTAAYGQETVEPQLLRAGQNATAMVW